MRMTLGLALKLVAVSGLIAAPLIVQVSLQTAVLADPPPRAPQIAQDMHQPPAGRQLAGGSSYQTATR